MKVNLTLQRVLILVSTTVDGLCAWKILQSLLHIDNVQYTLIPVDGKSHLENAFRTHSDQVRIKKLVVIILSYDLLCATIKIYHI